MRRFLVSTLVAALLFGARLALLALGLLLRRVTGAAPVAASGARAS